MFQRPQTAPITGTGSREIINLINTIGEKYHTASIIITHDMKCVQLTAQRVAMLIDGKCYATGTYDALKNNPDEKINLFFQ